MPARATFLALMLIVISVTIARTETPSTSDAVFFEAKVRPLLAARCFACHGPDTQESDLQLDAKQLLLQGGSSGNPAAVEGNPAASLIVKYTRREVEGMEMPPDEPLAAEEVAVLERWIQGGLFWPKDTGSHAPLTMAGRLQRDRDRHWAFRPVQPPPRPSRDAFPGAWERWPITPLDEFVLATLREHQLTPAPAADRRTLARRVAFDLLGLPPSPEAVDRFAADDRPDAYPQFVDRLLASPHYGQRWGRHWLDVARYADTRGYAFNRDRNYPFAFTYRDYVIDSFNQDLPYDEFVVQQLAADRVELGADNQPLAALGFLTVGRRFNNVHDDIDDKIDVVTRGLMGLTVACARCHDHKYDAIPTEDYYSLYGVFASSQEPDDLPLIGPPAAVEVYREYQQRLNTSQQKLRDLEQQLHKEITEHARTHITEYLLATLQAAPPDGGEKPPETSSAAIKLRGKLVESWRVFLKRKATADDPTLGPWFEIGQLQPRGFSEAAQARIARWGQLSPRRLNPLVQAALRDNPPKSRQEMARLYGRLFSETYQLWRQKGGNDAARDQLSAPHKQLLWFFFDQSTPTVIAQDKIKDYLTPSEQEQRSVRAAEIARIKETKPPEVARAMVLQDKSNPSDARVLVRGNPRRHGQRVPRRMPALLAGSERTSFQEGSGRLALARQIVDPGNPLTARVIVNRVWLHHFGQPLVETPSDFGVRSAVPVQVQVLNYLADSFMQSGWSLKQLHREILLSATYRQSSADRPECYRVDPENRLLWRMNRRRLEFEELRDALLRLSGRLDTTMGGKPVRLFEKPESGRRRSVYGYIDRQDLPNLLRVFDFASPDQSAAKRAKTIVPQQALFFLNSPLVIAQAQHLADLPELSACGSDEDYVDRLYHLLFARKPSDEEINVASDFLAKAEASASELTGREQMAQLLLLSNEFLFID